jgi:RNA polymerase sigma factor (sigma-70 family)
MQIPSGITPSGRLRKPARLGKIANVHEKKWRASPFAVNKEVGNTRPAFGAIDMETCQLATVIDHLRRTAGRPHSAGLTDGELVGAFLARHDAAAFETLVRRHGGMVLGVCRRVLGNVDDADDAFQATFMVLVRRAASVVPRDKVGNWLYGVAYKTSLSAKRIIARRRAREKQVTDMPHPYTDAKQDRLDLQHLLDQELSQLPEKYRLPVVLCDLEGRTRREVARQLRLPEGTLSNRLSAGRQRLAGRLTRRGLTLSAGSVATVLSQQASAALPPALVASTVNTAIQVAAAPAALAVLLPPALATLTQEVLRTMGLIKLKLIVALVLTLGMLGAGTAWTLQSADKSPAKGAPAAGKTVAVQKDDAAKKAQARSQEVLHDAFKEFNAATNEPRDLRHRLLADMAILQARLGDRRAALKLFEQARDIVDALPDESRINEWRMLAKAEAKAGAMDEAIATTRRIPEGNPSRDSTFQEVATELAKLMREKDALKVGDLIENPQQKSWVRNMLLEQAVLAYANAGKIPQALRMADRIEDVATRVSVLAGVVYYNLWFVDYPNEPGIALLQVKAGDKAGAEKTLRRAVELAATLMDEQGKARALTEVACVQARMGNVDAARKTAEGITREEGKAIALSCIVRAHVKAGQVKEALAAVNQAPNAATKVFLMTQMGGGQAMAGDRKGARESFRRAHVLLAEVEPNDRNLHAHNLASAQANAGYFQDAMETDRAFLPEGNLGYFNIAYARAEAGDFAGAVKAAEELQDFEWWKGNLLRHTAQLQTERGHEKAALDWISRLEAPLMRANALLGVAEGLLRMKKTS